MIYLSFVLSGGLIILVLLDRNRTRRSLALLALLVSLIAQLYHLMPLEPGPAMGGFLLLWSVGHFWLLGKFDQGD